MERAKDRLVAAALRLAAAERGGLDGEDNETELRTARSLFDDATHRYEQAMEEHFAQAGGGEDVPG